MIGSGSVSFTEEMSAVNDWQYSNDKMDIPARMAKTIGNSKVKRKKKRRSKDEAMEKEETEHSTESYSQDVVESSQQHLIYKRKSQLEKKNPDKSVEVLPDVCQSRLELREESTGDDTIVQRVEKKARRILNSELEVPEKKQKLKKKNTLLSMIHGSSNSSESDDEHRKVAASSVKSRHKSDTRRSSEFSVKPTVIISDREEERQSAGTTLLRNFCSSLKQGKSLNDDWDDRLKGRKSKMNCSKVEQKSLELQETIKTETLSTDTDSSSESASVSVKGSALKSERSRQDGKRKENHTVEKKRSNTLLSMIYDVSSSSEADNENKEIADRPTKSLDNGSLRKTSDATVREAIFTSDAEKEHESSDAEPLRNFSSLSERGKTLNDNLDNRLKGRKSEENCSKNKKKSLELQETIKTEILSTDADSSRESASISVKDSAKSERSRQHSKHKENHTVEKTRSNTLLAMIHDRSSSSESERGKTLNNNRDNRLKGRTSEKNCSQVKRKSLELQETIKTETLSTDSDSSAESIKVVASKSERLRINSKHKENHTIGKKRSNTLLSMIQDCSNSSESDDENKKIVGSSVKSTDKTDMRSKSEGKVGPVIFTSNNEEERQSLDTKHRKNFFSSLKQRITPNNDLDNQSKGRKSEKDSMNNDGKNPELESTIKTEKLSTHRDLSSESACISVKDTTSKSTLLRQHSKRKENTLLSMIHDSSESDDENKKIADRSGKSLNIKTLGKMSKSRISQTVTTSDEEEEHEVSNTKAVGKFVSPSKSRKTLDDYWKNETENLEVRKIAKSENVSMVEDSGCNSRDISVNDSKSESGVLLTKNRKHKVQRKVKKKKSNTLLSMIDDNSSNSDCKKERIKIEDDSEDSVNTANLRKRIKSDVSRVDMSSDDENGNQSLDMKPFNQLSKCRNFDLNVDDLEHLISVLEDEDEVPRETLRKLNKLDIRLQHIVPPQHMVETCAGSRGPTHQQKDIIEKFGPIKYGKYTPEEDDLIVKNWKSFCKVHNWNIRDVKPFLYMRHQRTGFVAGFSQRQKFVQYLANGLPWRTLYSVYWRFRNLYKPHLATRYTEDEDKLIIGHMENNASQDTRNVRKFSELAKILNRTRASVWRRYRLLKKKRNPNQKPQFDLHLAKKLIKNLIQLTLSKDVDELKDLDIPLAVWNRLSMKFHIDNKDLKQFWLTKLHMQLFCKEPVYLNDVKIKIIEYFYVSGITEWWEIEWANIAKHFDGMTPTFLSKMFNRLVHKDRLEGKELSEILEHLYEVKKPELQKAPVDKCLPRLVFKHGSLKLLGLDKSREN